MISQVWRGNIKDFLKFQVFRPVFVFLQRFGVSIIPRHFYSEIPYIARYQSGQDWRKPYSLINISTPSVSEQLSFVRKCVNPYYNTIDESELYKKAVLAQGEGGGYGPVEAEFFYSFVRQVMPDPIIQVGGGVSTAVIVRAARDHGYSPSVTVIDPYPSDYLSKLNKRNTIDLIAKKAQEVTCEIVELSGPDGLVFVDSTHTTVPNSEVNRLILEVLPRLPQNCWVHFHDITIPYDYNPSFLTQQIFFSRESLLLMAFLSCNDQYEVMLSQSLLHNRKPEAFSNLIPSYTPRKMKQGLNVEPKSVGHYPSSTFLRVTA